MFMESTIVRFPMDLYVVFVGSFVHVTIRQGIDIPERFVLKTSFPVHELIEMERSLVFFCFFLGGARHGNRIFFRRGCHHKHLENHGENRAPKDGQVGIVIVPW